MPIAGILLLLLQIACAVHVVRTGRSEFYPQVTDEMLVAGARGYLGRFVTREFKQRGAWVRALARNPDRLKTPGPFPRPQGHQPQAARRRLRGGRQERPN